MEEDKIARSTFVMLAAFFALVVAVCYCSSQAVDYVPEVMKSASWQEVEGEENYDGKVYKKCDSSVLIVIRAKSPRDIREILSVASSPQCEKTTRISENDAKP